MRLRAAASTICSTFEDALIDGESLSNSEVAWTPTAIALPEKLRKYSRSKAISMSLMMEQMPGSSTFYVLRSTFLDTCDQFVNKRHALFVILKSRRPLVLAIPAPLPYTTLHSDERRNGID
jgi:hypothetical protein